MPSEREYGNLACACRIYICYWKRFGEGNPHQCEKHMRSIVKTRKKVQRQNLLKKKAELIANRGQEPDTLVRGVRSPDSVEMAAHSVEQDVATWTVNLRFETLREIDGALNRLDDGGYGTCESCGERIASNRLKALPWARFCVACQEIGVVSVN